MILRQYDLAIYFEEVDNVINDPYIYPYEIKVDCSPIGAASVTIYAKEMDVPRNQKRKRRFRRFLLLAGMNEELVQLISDENVRVLNRHDFFTEQGTIVVLDYEVAK